MQTQATKLCNALVLSGAGTVTTASVRLDELIRMRGGLAIASVVSAIAGTTPSLTVTVQMTPDDDSVTDAAANWVTVKALSAQTATGVVVDTTTTGPIFNRVRASLALTGTGPSATATVSVQ